MFNHRGSLPGAQVKGFTLVELLLVCVIIGILAGVLYASVSNSTGQAREVAVNNLVRGLRTQLTAYRLNHAGAVPDADRLQDAMCNKTNLAGEVGAGDGYTFGPYYHAFPMNPLNNRRDVKEIPQGAPMTPDGSTGWLYRVDRDGFSIAVNDPRLDTGGRPFVEY